MKRQIKSLEEEKSKLQEDKAKLQEQLQIAQACEYSISYLDIALSIIFYWNILPSGSLGDRTRLITAARVIVDMVDPEEGSSNSKSLVERLEEATSKNYL